MRGASLATCHFDRPSSSFHVAGAVESPHECREHACVDAWPRRALVSRRHRVVTRPHRTGARGNEKRVASVQERWRRRRPPVARYACSCSASINASAHSIVLDAAAAQVQFKITGVLGHLPDTKNHDKRTAQIALTLSRPTQLSSTATSNSRGTKIADRKHTIARNRHTCVSKARVRTYICLSLALTLTFYSPH